ncbi:MAG: TatD family hydrolase [Clostridiales bacterium]|nr:TatD family hydrolase [Candidatus Blautia equi]
MIFDTHAHYDDEQFDEDREALLASMQENGIGTLVNVCASVHGLQNTVDLMDRYPFVYGAIGVHPDDAGEMTEETLDTIRRLSDHEKAVAIGEIGLDYYWHKEEAEHEVQKRMFRAQMDIAREKKLPFIIHSRDAAEDTLKIVKEYMQGGMYGGIIHCFSYSKEIAAQYLDMGLYLGIGGVVTFKNAKKLKEVVEMAPLSQILLETDCPYMSPEPYRGKRNSSLNLPYVAAKIAELKGITPEEVVQTTEENARKLFGIE